MTASSKNNCNKDQSLRQFIYIAKKLTYVKQIAYAIYSASPENHVNKDKSQMRIINHHKIITVWQKNFVRNLCSIFGN